MIERVSGSMAFLVETNTNGTTTFYRTAQSRRTRFHPMWQKLRNKCICQSFTCPHVEKENLPKHQGGGRVQLIHLDEAKCVQSTLPAYQLLCFASEFETSWNFLKCLDSKLRVIHFHWPGEDILYDLRKNEIYQSQPVGRGRRVGRQAWQGNQQWSLHPAHQRPGPEKTQILFISFFFQLLRWHFFHS